MKNKDAIDTILTESERVAVERLVNDGEQLEAVKKVILFEIYGNGVLEKNRPSDAPRNFLLDMIASAEQEGLSREALGERLQSVWAGVRLLEMGFNTLASFKRFEISKKVAEKNPAR